MAQQDDGPPLDLVGALRRVAACASEPTAICDSGWERAACAAVESLLPGPLLVIVLQAGLGFLGAALALALEGRCSGTVLLLDRRYFRRGANAVSLRHLERLEAQRGEGCTVTMRAQRDPRGRAAHFAALRDAVERSGAEKIAVLASSLIGTDALDAVRLFDNLAKSGRAVNLAIARCAAPESATLRTHADNKAIYRPCTSAPGFSARSIRHAVAGDSRDALWCRRLRAALRESKSASVRLSLEGRLNCGCGLAARCSIGEALVPLRAPCAPLVAFMPDQLEALREAVFAMLELSPYTARLECGMSIALRRSTADRYASGGYADRHYVSACPNEREACFELFDSTTEEALGFCSIGASEFGGEDWPFDDLDAPLNLASVSRIVLLESARGRGALPHLLHPCSIYHALGIPVRIATRKQEVARKALGKLVGAGVLSPDDAPRRLRHTQAADARAAVVTAIVPYTPPRVPGSNAADPTGPEDAAETRRVFHTRTVCAPRARGRNADRWQFWYVGANVVHARTGVAYEYVGGKQRFSPLLSEPRRANVNAASLETI